jgi:hypothetical protein
MSNVGHGNSRRKGIIIGELGGKTNERVEISWAIGPQNCVLVDEILHRKTKGVKFDGTPIIMSKFVHRD